MAALQPFLLQAVLLLLLQQAVLFAMARRNTIEPHCQEFCGNYSIPYPFGIGPGCHRNDSFNYEVTCKETSDGSMLPFAGGAKSTIPVFNFSVSRNQATMLKYLSYHCYNSSGLVANSPSGLNLTGSPFSISATHNKFTAIGCNTIAFINGTGGAYASGCMSFCKRLDNSSRRSCTGTGCCQTSLPENLMGFHSTFFQRNADDRTWRFNPCSYAFVADQDWFKFDASYLVGEDLQQKFGQGVPLVLDWLAGNVTCDEAKKNSSSYACRSSNSNCLDSPLGIGYACNCSQGYEGNPYRH